jgi:hypothetical protein
MAFRKRNAIKEKFNLGLPFLYTPEEKKTEEFRETSEPIFEHVVEPICKANKETDYIEQYGDKIAKSYPTPAFYAKGNTVALCIYRIINDRTRPFLQFLLVCEDGKSFKMPTIKHVDNSMKELINRTSKEVQQFFSGLDKETETEYKGFILNENEKAAIVFAAHDYMLTVDKYDTDFSEQTKNNTKMKMKTKTKEKKWCWVLPTEIVNDGSCMNIPIDEADTDFFCKNNAMINLYTESEAQTHTEAPMVAYSIATESTLEYQCIFGAPRASSSYYYGPYYLFGSYNQTILEMAQRKKQDNKLIMMRSLFFPGKVKVSVDTERDHTERDHTERDHTENKAEQDIEWTDRYDSVFFVDSATKHVKYICKSRNQQQTLSYIYIT